MSFESKSISCATLQRGLALLEGASHSMLHDPELDAMQEELQVGVDLKAALI